MSGRGCTAGNTGTYATGNAVEWGLCPCGEGSDEDDGWEVPLFESGDGLACAGCCEESTDEH